MPTIWELEAEVRRMLRSGVNFERAILGVTGLDGDDVIKWVKLEGGAPKRLLVIYVKDAARITVTALVREDGQIDITSVSLDKMCGGGSTYA